ncbi:MAG: metallophosphoesterase [Bryobacteraceae bacterium]
MRLTLLLASCATLFAQKDLGRILPESKVLRVVGLGDFGSGNNNQRAVARAMAHRHEQEPFQLGISLGDNFYRCGVNSVNDATWDKRWEELYTPLGIPFYTSLGNHDYGNPPVICPGRRSSAQTEIDRSELSQSWRMPARYYTYLAGPVRFFALDTEGWTAEQLAWLTSALKTTQGEPGVHWRVVYGHHPMFTSGVHLNQRRIGALRRQLTPLFKETGVDVYIAGHDHDMEHLRAEGLEFLINGAGGANLRKIKKAQPQSVFHATTFGFLDLTIDEHSLVAKFLDTNLVSLENPTTEIRK